MKRFEAPQPVSWEEIPDGWEDATDVYRSPLCLEAYVHRDGRFVERRPSGWYYWSDAKGHDMRRAWDRNSAFRLAVEGT